MTDYCLRNWFAVRRASAMMVRAGFAASALGNTDLSQTYRLVIACDLPNEFSRQHLAIRGYLHVRLRSERRFDGVNFRRLIYTYIQENSGYDMQKDYLSNWLGHSGRHAHFEREPASECEYKRIAIYADDHPIDH